MRLPEVRVKNRQETAKIRLNSNFPRRLEGRGVASTYSTEASASDFNLTRCRYRQLLGHFLAMQEQKTAITGTAV
jgi:hypothetical protein